MTQNVKLQTTIPNSNIVIDSWDIKQADGRDPSIRFMTSINNHSTRAIKQMRNADYRIYTSLFNKWYLHQFYQISEDRIMVLNHGQTMEIFDPDRNEKITVTAIEANYCAGSSMFLFQGSFGNVLYTGFFRLSSPFEAPSCPELKEVVEQDALHLAYVDNSYAAEHCNFASRIDMIKRIIDLIRSSSNCRIVISSKPWGKEEVFLAIASELDEKVDVGLQRYSIFEKIGIFEFFTCQSKEARIRALDHLLTFSECRKIFQQDKSCIIILMTAVYKYGWKKFPWKSKFPRLFIIPYSGHCNHVELKEFVRTLKPQAVLPVLLPKTHQRCSVIPKSIHDLCSKVNEPNSSVEEEDRETYIEKSNPSVVIPRLQVSPLRLKRINGSYCASTAVAPVKRKSFRLPVAARACECSSDKANSTDLYEVSGETVATSQSSNPNTRLSSTSTCVKEKERSLEKSLSNAHSFLPLPPSPNASPRPANDSVTEERRSPEKRIDVSVIRDISRSSNSGHPSASASPTSHASAVEEERCAGNTTSNERHIQSVEVDADVVESVPYLSPSAAEGYSTGNENESRDVNSPDNHVVEELLNLNDVVTPRRVTESEEPELLSEDDMVTVNTHVYYSEDRLLVGGVADPSEAVTPPLREIEKAESLRKSRINAANLFELEDPIRTTASTPDNCFIREESRNVLLDSASPRVNQNEENIIDDRPLTLRLQEDDICSISEDYRNVLLGRKFPHICQREEHEEMPLASRLESDGALCGENYITEEYVDEEMVPSTGDICPGGEASLPSSKHSNDEAVEADSADSSKEVFNTCETASLCEDVSDAAGIKSTTSSDSPHRSNIVEDSLPVRTINEILNAAISESTYNRLVAPLEKDVISVSVVVNATDPASISNFQPVCNKRNRSEDDVTLFELDERVTSQTIVTEPASNTTTLEGGSNYESAEEDSCILVECNRPVNNSSHSVIRASPDGRMRGSVDADQSDSDDCVVVGEYIRETQTPNQALKRLRLDTTYLSRKNRRYVNAIFFHYMKSRPQEMSRLPFDHYDFLSECNIYSHFAYKRA